MSAEANERTITHVHYFKYDGTEHWRIETELTREDDAGWWLRGFAGAKAERPGLVVVEKVGFLCFVPRDAWWAAFWNFDRENDFELYIDIATLAAGTAASTCSTRTSSSTTR